MNNSSGRKNKSIASTILVAAVLLAWWLIRPQLDKWLPTAPGDAPQNAAVDATESADSTNQRADGKPSDSSEPPGQRQQPDDAGGFELRKVGRNYESPAGLVYTPGSREGHRRDHVLRHARDDPDKPVHGVFDDKAAVFALVDEAYEKVKSRSSDVETKQEGNRTVHTVHMQRRVGFKGGRSGRQQNNPPLNRIRLVLEGNRIITAYPY